jgi:ZIP family zinc transporter
MAESTPNRSPWNTAALFLLPLVLLAAVIAVFQSTGGAGLKAEPAAPIESLAFERTVLKAGLIELVVRNTGPQALTIAQIAIRDAFVPFTIRPGPSIPRLGRAVIHIPYPWVRAEAYDIRLFSGNSIPFDTVIAAAAETRRADAATLAGFTLIGIYVGVIPVFLGIFWFPALRKLGRRVFLWLMALTVGLLLFLGIDATNEALEMAATLGGPFQGVGLTGIGVVATSLALYAIARHQTREGRDPAGQPARIALMIAVGIGLHNLGEGLAIGASFSIGAAALGTFLVIGFILQNITEGLGIIAPIVRQRPSLRLLAGLGLIGGVPAIIGTWTGGLARSQVLALLFLAIGAGAVFEVAYEIGRLIRQDSQAPKIPLTLASGVVSGMLVLYVTGLLIK